MGKKLDALGDRMKKYEYVTRTSLVPRMPVIIRIDGKAFHTLTRGFKRPFDEALIATMQNTTKYLCENIQGCVLGYTQSDEITLVLVDYKNLDSCAWFDNNIQKMCSIAASMATMAFNKYFKDLVQRLQCDYLESWNRSEAEEKYLDALATAADKGALFDARVFNIPKEEVCNCVLWRQNDATRNSIEMVGQANFSHKVLQNKSCAQIQDMLMLEKGINWNDYPAYQKRGSCCIKSNITVTASEEVDGEVYTSTIERPHWIIDRNIPIFKGEGRKYIDDLVYVGES